MKLAWFVAACMLLDAPIYAREPVDPRLPTWQQSHLAEGSMEDRILRAFAYCIVRTQAGEAERFLASARGTTEERASALAIVGKGPNDCAYRSDIHFRGEDGLSLFRGLIAEFLYNRDIAGSRRYAARSDPTVAADTVSIGADVAACTVARMPNEVHALIRFDHDSPGETRMLRALRPAMLECLPAGRWLPVSRHVMRAMLAEALYHLSRAGADPLA